MTSSEDESSINSNEEYHSSEEEEMWNDLFDSNLNDSNVDLNQLNSFFTDEILKITEDPRDSDDSLYFPIGNSGELLMNDPSTDCTYKDVIIQIFNANLK